MHRDDPEPDAWGEERWLRMRQIRISVLIQDIARMRRLLIDQRMAPCGLTHAQWSALANIARMEEKDDSGQGVVQTALARMLNMGKGALGEVLSRLEAAGYIRRLVDGTDRRIKRISLTAEGTTILNDLAGIYQDLNGSVFSGLSPDSAREIERALHRIRSNVSTQIDKNGLPDN